MDGTPMLALPDGGCAGIGSDRHLSPPRKASRLFMMVDMKRLNYIADETLRRP
jgi:hypothetical protein